MPTNIRHRRHPLFRSPSVPGGTPTIIPGSAGLGCYQTGGFSRFTGMVQAVGSMTLQWRMGVHSGRYLVTSSIIVNSGNSVFEANNFGTYADFAIITANSQTPDFLIMGEPIR